MAEQKYTGFGTRKPLSAAESDVVLSSQPPEKTQAIEVTRRPQNVRNAKSKEAESSELAQAVIIGALTGLGTLFALIFGIFAILSWQMSTEQKQVALLANEIALLQYCGNADSLPQDLQNVCANINNQMLPILTNLAISVLSISPATTPVTPTAISTLSRSVSGSGFFTTVTPTSLASETPSIAPGAGKKGAGLGTDARIGLGVGLSALLFLLIGGAVAYVTFKRRRRYEMDSLYAMPQDDRFHDR